MMNELERVVWSRHRLGDDDQTIAAFLMAEGFTKADWSIVWTPADVRAILQDASNPQEGER